jgi:hypothetical protein
VVKDSAMPPLTPRGRLIRDTILYTPPFAFLVLALVLMIVGVWDRSIVGIVLVAGITFLFGYQSVQSIRDLTSKPRELDGPIQRRWTKRDGFVVKNYYVSVGKSIFHIAVDDYMLLKTGDVVRVLAYPHTGTLVSINKLEDGPPRPVEQGTIERVRGRARTLRTARATPREHRDTPSEPRQDES